MHSEAITVIKFNTLLNAVFSFDRSGVIEIWDPETYDLPEVPSMKYDMLSDTDTLAREESKTRHAPPRDPTFDLQVMSSAKAT